MDLGIVTPTVAQKRGYRDMVALQPDDAWVVGELGLILHWDGKSWSKYEDDVSGDLRAIWAISDHDIWAAGDFAARIHYDGVAFSAPELATPEMLDQVSWHSIWASSSNDVWVGGLKPTGQRSVGVIAHFDGASWTTDAGSFGSAIISVRGRSATDVWALSLDGKIFHYDGKAWSPFPAIATFYASAVSPSSVMWFGGLADSLGRLDGSDWTLIRPQAMVSMMGGEFVSVWAGASGQVLAARHDGVIESHDDGVSWSTTVARTSFAALKAEDEGFRVVTRDQSGRTWGITEALLFYSGQ